MWIEKETSIAEIKTLLENGYEVEVDSPDGYVPVNCFINKGMYDEYKLQLLDNTEVKCNEGHLFETTDGWISAKEIEQSNLYYEFVTSDGIRIGKVVRTNKQIPIVDINVNHPNHRYYTNGISSHNTNVGKTLAMCHLASSFLLQSKNILYITLEMSENEIAKRIDANILDTPINQLENLAKSNYTNKVVNLQQKTQGKLIIKEYPTASAHVGHFKSLLNELALKKSFHPDVVFIDYINICTSMRFRTGNNANSYTIIKSIAEELRGLAVEYNVPIFSCTQTTRSSFSSSDIEITDTSECIFVDEKVELRNGVIKKISEVEVGDQIKSQDEYKTVMMVHHKKEKECIKITTKSGKQIIVSKDHVFPTNTGRKSFKSGLSVGDYLNIN